jgi:NADH-quinone oxidoreductase subunit J
MQQIVLFLFITITVIGALAVVFSPKILHVTFGLLVALFGVGGIYITLGADFLGITQVLVYVGGVLILLLFGLMLSKEDPLTLDESNVKAAWTKNMPVAMGCVLLFFILSIISSQAATFLDISTLSTPANSMVENVGINTMTRYLLPFEAVSILLLIALIGAAYLARRKAANPRKVF